jgi:hypothetical protein
MIKKHPEQKYKEYTISVDFVVKTKSSEDATLQLQTEMLMHTDPTFVSFNSKIIRYYIWKVTVGGNKNNESHTCSSCGD